MLISVSKQLERSSTTFCCACRISITEVSNKPLLPVVFSATNFKLLMETEIESCKTLKPFLHNLFLF